MCVTERHLQSKKNGNRIESESHDSGRPVLLRYWEIENMFKCPVVGMCLTFLEQKQLLKKSGISIKKKNPFDIHETLVAASDDENRLSRKVDNLLRRKFGNEAASLLGHGHHQFIAHWRKAFEAGDCLAALWAAAASPDLPLEYRREVFGAVHMTMHWSADQSIKLKQKIANQQNQIDTMSRATKEAAGDRRTLRKENKRLRRSENDLTTKLAAMETEKTRLNDILAEFKNQSQLIKLEAKNRCLQDNLDEVSLKLNKNGRQIVLLTEQNMQLSAELERQREMTERFKTETREIVEKFVALNHCDTDCPSYDLCQKRVLIVGGMTRMESLYREFIESSGGVFDYHDGYVKNGIKRLESSLKRADVVLCPVSCNSHAACSIVKNLAKKHCKTVHMLNNSSLNAVSQVIWGTTDDNNKGFHQLNADGPGVVSAR